MAPAGYVHKDRACYICGTVSKRVYKVDGYYIKACCQGHAEKRIYEIGDLLKSGRK